MIKNHSQLIDRQEVRRPAVVRLEVARTLDELADHKEAWDKFAGSVAVKLPTLSYAWFRARVKTQLKKSQNWFCLFAYHEDRMVGAMPLLAMVRKPLGVPMLVLKTPPGSSEILQPGSLGIQSIRLMIDYIRNLEPAVLSLKLNQLSDSSPWLSILDSFGNRFHIMREFYGRNSYLPIMDDFESYRSSLSKNFKRNLKRRGKKLDKLDNVEYCFCSSGEANTSGIDAFSRIEASGWKGRKGTALAQQEELYNFYNELTEDSDTNGLFQWHFLRAEGKIIAAQLAAEMSDTLIVIKIAYDEEYADYSPGNLLFEETIKRAYKQGNINLIDCMTDQNWHSNWNMSQRDKFSLYVFPRRILPIMAGLLPYKAKKIIHGIGRKFPGAKRIYSRFTQGIDPNQ